MPARSSTPGGNVVLIGFMGSGKTEVGRRLATATGRHFIDTDALVEAGGLTIPDIFASEGETGFRRREREAVQRASKSKGSVISTGGGTVLLAENVKALKKTGVVVYLRAGVEDLSKRLEESAGRPLLDSPEEGRRTDRAGRRRRIADLYAARVPLYEAAADIVVDVEGRRADTIAREIVKRLDVTVRAAPLQSVAVDVAAPYSVFVGRGVLRRAAALLPIQASAEKACIVSHPRVARLWGGALGEGLRGTRLRLNTFTFPEGEERKTLETAARIYKRLAMLEFHRGDLLLALGGGVVGDLSGFVASTYARGIPVVQVPTTLLGMVDSAIGGKTGFNLPEGKNLIGTFHHPIAVLADLDTLKTIPDREFRGGLAEVVKYALISDPSLGQELVEKRDAILARSDALGPIVMRSAEIKAKVVAGDEREMGDRVILNYGHTVGHALESLGIAGALRSGRLHHGEAVAIGMVFASWLSVVLGLAGKDLVEEHVRLLDAVGLPTQTGRVSWDDLARYVALDKKHDRALRFVLLEAPGKPTVVRDVPQQAITEALQHVTETV